MTRSNYRKIQILVIGYNSGTCTPEAEAIAFRVGKAVAKKGSKLLEK